MARFDLMRDNQRYGLPTIRDPPEGLTCKIRVNASRGTVAVQPGLRPHEAESARPRLKCDHHAKASRECLLEIQHFCGRVIVLGAPVVVNCVPELPLFLG